MGVIVSKPGKGTILRNRGHSNPGEDPLFKIENLLGRRGEAFSAFDVASAEVVAMKQLLISSGRISMYDDRVVLVVKESQSFVLSNRRDFPSNVTGCRCTEESSLNFFLSLDHQPENRTPSERNTPPKPAAHRSVVTFHRTPLSDRVFDGPNQHFPAKRLGFSLLLQTCVPFV